MEKYIRVPIQIIKLSCESNHAILPAYLYAGINCNSDNNYIVDTNLVHIAETFCPNSDPRRQIIQKFSEALNILSLGNEDKSNRLSFSSCISQCVLPEQDPKIKESFLNVTKNTRIRFVFKDRKVEFLNGFTIVEFNEYYYLMNKIEENNQNKKNKERWNLIDLLNFYCYLKMRINLVKNSSEKISEYYNMTDTISSMAKNMSVGPKTITKYINILCSLKMISVSQFIKNNKTINNYFICQDWKNN